MIIIIQNFTKYDYYFYWIQLIFYTLHIHYKPLYMYCIVFKPYSLCKINCKLYNNYRGFFKFILCIYKTHDYHISKIQIIIYCAIKTHK